ncbi:DNA-directed RNA polymerase subunit beta [Ignavigranum ruoffiae]|uniref:DNA-directed RNA polymerase subunit beta n=1 Tax=Ignavigranum ruoffiae TaxID=89093 RepID=A0A1H9E265_9LACT|nr:DNA-directed RNA polymerase subunit beta [Ignavigranum ruoffiae]UPQ85304.1 DNA-directed RNA polymerase subunit beta [Ignavigranum ruoffiae]SEQ19829.1 DNA-directed RNA polymerase subunit beta [Ignavigranum ruoffiae]
MEDTYLKESTLLRGLKVLVKFLVFLLLVILCFIIGLFIGYSVIGGGPYWEVLNQETWQHIINFIK